jgi:hypothetical protein
MFQLRHSQTHIKRFVSLVLILTVVFILAIYLSVALSRAPPTWTAAAANSSQSSIECSDLQRS